MALTTGSEYKATADQMKVNAYLDGPGIENLLADPVTRTVD
jgi:hypothetical protein